MNWLRHLLAWRVLLANYEINKGRLWPLLLLWVAIAPYLFFRFARSHSATTHN